MAQLAVAWVIANKDVSTCILGASKVSQLDENFKALEVYKKLTPVVAIQTHLDMVWVGEQIDGKIKVTPEILTEIETILDNCPLGEMDFRDRNQLNVRRNIDLGVNFIKK